MSSQRAQFQTTPSGRLRKSEHDAGELRRTPAFTGCGSNGVTWDTSTECHKSPANWQLTIRAGRASSSGTTGIPVALRRLIPAVVFFKAFKERFTSRKSGPDAALTPESSVNPGIRTSLP
jgi:hypothetical protein